MILKLHLYTLSICCVPWVLIWDVFLIIVQTQKKKKKTEKAVLCLLILDVYLYTYACTHSIYHLSNIFRYHLLSILCQAYTMTATLTKPFSSSPLLLLLFCLEKILPPALVKANDWKYSIVDVNPYWKLQNIHPFLRR